MVRVSETEFSRDIATFQTVAMGEPVVLTQDGRDKTVVISVEEYERLRRSARKSSRRGNCRIRGWRPWKPPKWIHATNT